MFENDQARLKHIGKSNKARKSELGQFLTPYRIAKFMTGLFQQTENRSCCILDPGAGLGILTTAFIDRIDAGELEFNTIMINAFEIDDAILPGLHQFLDPIGLRPNFSVNIFSRDFITESVKSIQKSIPGSYTHAILNPPYKKINSESDYRKYLRLIGIETVNLYSAFVAISLTLLRPGGQLVAIIPRSFCNGTYYRPFRDYLLHYSAIRQIHLFHSRDQAFSDEGVLQENVIVYLERNGKQGDVNISTSTDDTFSDLQLNRFPFERIVSKDDPERFIHIPTTSSTPDLNGIAWVNSSLKDIGIKVSTGPVVDFRLSDYLVAMPEAGTVPLLYPGHFLRQVTTWPIKESKKPNAIRLNPDTKKWLFPNGHYVVVKRFSSKEERRRIVASVVSPEDFPFESLGFENHLNVFHINKHGLPVNIAYGLAAHLNSAAVDQYFRLFSGHTQVNSTDLRNLKYPDFDTLNRIGEQVASLSTPEEIEAQITSLS